jgi:hypothetical protein
MSLQNAQKRSAQRRDVAQPDTRLSREAAIVHPTFVTRVMALWDEGLDTWEIANRLLEHEHVVACCVRVGRECRRSASPNIATTEE